MKKNFDYIIIGAGSAGCVLANRLSANGKHSVLILEAGGKDNDQNVKIPAGFANTFKTEMDYGYSTTPQSTMANREIYLPRGRMLGGCSSNNAMIYIRGSKQDYNEWSEMGNKGWSYDEVLPYFKKSENQEIFKNELHGTGGPLNVTNRNYTNHLSDVFVKAGLELGFDKNEDFNGEQQDGFGRYQVTQVKGERCSAARGFLHPASSRSNLTVEIKAEVERIVIENDQATGVVYHQNGQKHEVKANKEVILSAGTYNSPKVLMLSGIGDSKELQKHKIPVVKHLSGVGKNLQDHCVFFAIFHSNYKQTLDSAENFPGVLKHLFNYFVFKKGPLNSNVAESGGFVKSSPKQPSPDIQLHFGPAYFVEHGFGNPDKGNGFTVTSTLLNPSSKGTVTLASSNYKDAPLIDHNYLSTEDDVKRAVWAQKLNFKLGLSKAFEPYRTGFFIPSQHLSDDKAIEEDLRKNSQTIYHPSSTCKMGNDEMAVVNHELKVHGIKGLRVVDASIMPNVTRGNTNAPTIMIAEKAADMILGK